MNHIVKRSNFEVSFVDDDDQPLAALKQLEHLVIAADIGTELLSQEGLGHRTNTLIVWLADDWASNCISGIRQHVEGGNKRFKTLVKVTDGLKLKELYVFQHCELSALQHSIFTRESQAEQLLVPFKGTTIQGSINPPESRELSAKLLQVAFASFEHHIIGKTQ